jgi:hypothetical protein
LFAALHADSWVDWEKEETELGSTAGGGDVVELGSTAASTLSVEDVDVLGNGDLLSAGTGLGGWVEGGGTAASSVGSGGSSDYSASRRVSREWAAKIVGCGVVSADTTANVLTVQVAVDLAAAAKLGSWGIGLETATCA